MLIIPLLFVEIEHHELQKEITIGILCHVYPSTFVLMGIIPLFLEATLVLAAKVMRGKLRFFDSA